MSYRLQYQAALTVVLILACNEIGLNAKGAEPKLHTIETDGKVTEAHFYGPSSWLSSPGERLSKFPDLEKITLACGKIGAEEMKYLATVRSLKHLATMELPEDSVEFAPGSLDELRAMEWLESLAIYQNALPTQEWQFLSKLNSLNELHLDCFNGLAFIDGRAGLEYLYLHRGSGSNTENAIPQVVGTLRNLKHLAIYSTSINPVPLPNRSLKLLAELPSLTSLSLDAVGPEELGFVGKLVNLEHLTLQSVSSECDIASLRRLNRLRELILTIESLKFTDPAVFGDFQMLEFLSLRCKEPHDEAVERIPFEELRRLEKIYLWTASIEKDVIARVATLPRLQEILVKSLRGSQEDLAPTLLRQNISLIVLEKRPNGSGCAGIKPVLDRE